MIGQAAIGNPRIFSNHVPTPQEKCDTIIRHLDLMLACEAQFEEILNNHAAVREDSIFPKKK